MRITLVFVMLLVICGNLCAMNNDSRANIKKLDFSGKNKKVSSTPVNSPTQNFIIREVDMERQINTGARSTQNFPRRPSAPRDLRSSRSSRRKKR